MKKDIHPEYNTDAEIKCSCGNVLKVGSVKKQMAIEICSACHPFFTGKEKIIDTAGRVEKFKARQSASKKSEVRSTKSQTKSKS